MTDQVFFAAVDLPFHFWVRERSERGFRWVLREAPHLHHGSRDVPAAKNPEPPPTSPAGT